MPSCTSTVFEKACFEASVYVVRHQISLFVIRLNVCVIIPFPLSLCYKYTTVNYRGLRFRTAKFRGVLHFFFFFFDRTIS